MYIRLTQPKLLSSVPRITTNPALRRKHFPIAIIDNDPFLLTKELTYHGFDITELGDIRDFPAVSEYPIVACDIKDVGRHFGTKYEGAHVIAEIRKRYPDKFLIAYSAGMFSAEYTKYFDACDVFLRRDVGFDQWRESLDKGIEIIGDPAIRWNRVRVLLLESGMTTFDVFLIEDAYISSFKKKDPFILEKALTRAASIRSTGEIVQSISHGLITVVKLAIKTAELF